MEKTSKLEKPPAYDRISDLPHEILCHILTFLPTKFAFATSVLSKRWISLYHSLTFIKFDDKSIEDHDQFLHFCRSVEAVTLSPHVQQKPIKKFYLRCGRYGNWHIPPIDVWIKAINQRGVDYIHLSMNLHRLMPVGDELIRLSNVLFNSQNLVVLKLNNLVLSTKILSVNLPSLKALHLKSVYLEIKDFKKLFSGCPILKELHTDHFYGKWLKLGYEPNLSKLVRASICPFDVPFKAVYNVKSLCILQLDSDHSVDIINSYYKDFPVFKKLIHLEICFRHCDHDWDNLAKLLKHSPKLQTLLIRKRSSSYLTFRKDWENPNSIPKCVSSRLKRCEIRHYEGRNGDLQFARYILQNARFLQVMKLGVSSPSYRKSKIIEDLSSCPRSSEGCKLLFASYGQA